MILQLNNLNDIKKETIGEDKMSTKLRQTIKVAYFTFWISVFFTRTSYAYIDPATTSYLFQIVAGLFIAFGASIVVFRKKITTWFQQLKLHLEESTIKRKAEKKK